MLSAASESSGVDAVWQCFDMRCREIADHTIAHQADDAVQSLVLPKTFPLLEIVNRATHASGKVENQSRRRSEDLYLVGMQFFFLNSPCAVRRHPWGAVLLARLHHR